MNNCTKKTDTVPPSAFVRNLFSSHGIEHYHIHANRYGNVLHWHLKIYQYRFIFCQIYSRCRLQKSDLNISGVMIKRITYWAIISRVQVCQTRDKRAVYVQSICLNRRLWITCWCGNTTQCEDVTAVNNSI